MEHATFCIPTDSLCILKEKGNFSVPPYRLVAHGGTVWLLAVIGDCITDLE